MRLILHAFEHTPLLNKEFGNRSSFESMADLNSVLAQGEKERPLRALLFIQKESFSCKPTLPPHPPCDVSQLEGRRRPEVNRGEAKRLVSISVQLPQRRSLSAANLHPLEVAAFTDAFFAAFA